MDKSATARKMITGYRVRIPVGTADLCGGKVAYSCWPVTGGTPEMLLQILETAFTAFILCARTFAGDQQIVIKTRKNMSLTADTCAADTVFLLAHGAMQCCQTVGI
jgi:hypothetical protein